MLGCTAQHLCDALRPDPIQADYYQSSGEVVLKDTDYFKWKTYTDQLEACVY